MKILILSILIIIFIPVSAKRITDMAGRDVTIPYKITRILPYDSKTSILLFPVAKDVMSAKSIIPGSKTHQFISDDYNKMAEIDVKNIEAVLVNNPQVIIAGTFIGKGNYERFNKLQKRTHIPLIIIDLSLYNLNNTYQFLSSILTQNDACKACISFLTSFYNQCSELMNKNEAPTKSIYYTIGGSGLTTDPSGSKHTEVLDFLNLNNVAKIAIPNGGHANVNMEQILEWNPEYIFTAGFKADKNAYNHIKTSSIWKNIAAVNNNQIYKVPSKPFGWFDHPPTINRIAGIIWLSHIFYNLPKEKMKKQIIDFYSLFYKYNLTEEEYNSLF